MSSFLNSKEYKLFRANNLKDKGAHIYKYRDGRLSPVLIPQPKRSGGKKSKAKKYEVKIKQPYAAEALVAAGYDVSDSFNIMRAFNTLVIRDSEDTNIRHSKIKGGAFEKLSQHLIKEYFIEHHYEKDNQPHIGYRALNGDDSKLSAILDDFVDTKFFSGLKRREKHNRYMTLMVDDFKCMPVADKMRALKYLETISLDGTMYINKYRKRGAGNYCRNYETIVEFPRISRQWFRLYGWDLEAALQNIWYQECLRISPDSEFPITLDLITNKKKFRANIAKYVFADLPRKKALEAAKTFITKIYQGYRARWRLNDAGKFWFDLIVAEVDKMMEIMIIDAIADVGNDQIKTAAHNVDIKMLKKFRSEEEYSYQGKPLCFKDRDKYDKAQKFKLDKSLVFYLWTYEEQRIMEVIHRRIKNPIDILDARYTQNKVEFDELNKLDWSVLILEETGYEITVKAEKYLP